MRWALVCGLLLLLTMSYLFARLEHQSSVWSIDRPLVDEALVPPPAAAAALALNHRTFAADIAWIGMLISVGEHKRLRRPLTRIEHQARLVQALDPNFYRLYDWFPAVYLYNTFPVSESDIETANAFIDLGIEQFPERYELPYSAAMNYIGFSASATPERRLREIERAISYLERAAQLEGAPASIAGTLAYFYGRRRQLLAERGENIALTEADRQAEAELYARLLLLTPDPNLRKRLEEQLADSPARKRKVGERARAYARRFVEAKDAELPYLPDGVWTTVARESHRE